MEKNLKKYIYIYTFKRIYTWASQVVLVVKNPPANAADIRDLALIPGSGRCPGEWNGNPLQYSYPENSMDRGSRWATDSPWGPRELDTVE